MLEDRDLGLLTPRAMSRVDRAAMSAGIPGIRLMENAGRAVVREIVKRFPPSRTLVLCGPGNNGGDGFVVARRLRELGWPVRLACLVPVARLSGDAALAAARWPGPVEPFAGLDPGRAELVVDAIFGAGLAREVADEAARAIRKVTERRLPVVAVDVPSGVDGASGEVRGTAFRACLTVTFVRAKPGHFLLPGRLLRGELVVSDIGIDDRWVRAEDEGLRRSHPRLFRHLLPARTPESHKYRFGHLYVVGGPKATTGAARLAALAGLRVGAGLVSVLCEADALEVYACQLTTVMTKPFADETEFRARIADPRISAFVFGPGAQICPATRARTLELLASGRPVVLDADALSVFADRPATLFAALRPDCVLTPHDGEYARLFGCRGSRLERAREAARLSGAVVLLKGADTVVAAPDGRAVIQDEAPPTLATAGTGDVLAGILGGLLAQGVPAFEAAVAATWIHAQAAARIGRPLIAEDLPAVLPEVLAALLSPPEGIGLPR
ncbi:Bifunctional NAD(P)H-hydrate repair enzyme Nnr [bacterium HR40]|nr:Bifunctional NAD(P)H-hydrate repair enzyme Nnr [bacterium HR40]